MDNSRLYYPLRVGTKERDRFSPSINLSLLLQVNRITIQGN